MKTALASQTPWQGLGDPQRSPDCRWGGERAGTGAGLPLRVRRGSQPAPSPRFARVWGDAPVIHVPTSQGYDDQVSA